MGSRGRASRLRLCQKSGSAGGEGAQRGASPLPLFISLLMTLLLLATGPTGCGKTEIARRLAKLADAPFVKVGRPAAPLRVLRVLCLPPLQRPPAAWVGLARSVSGELKPPCIPCWK